MGTKAHRRTWGRAFSEDDEAVHDVEVRADGSPQARSTPLPAPLPPDSDFVEFAVTGTDVSGEYRCADCGYGAVIRRALPPCPMCGSTIWERRAPRPAD